MKKEFLIVGLLIFAIFYFKDLRKMVPKGLIKQKKLFMGIGIAMIIYGILNQKLLEGQGNDESSTPYGYCSGPDYLRIEYPISREVDGQTLFRSEGGWEIRDRDYCMDLLSGEDTENMNEECFVLDEELLNEEYGEGLNDGGYWFSNTSHFTTDDAQIPPGRQRDVNDIPYLASNPETGSEDRELCMCEPGKVIHKKYIRESKGLRNNTGRKLIWWCAGPDNVDPNARRGDRPSRNSDPSLPECNTLNSDTTIDSGWTYIDRGDRDYNNCMSGGANFNPDVPIYENISINNSNDRGNRGYFNTDIGKDTWNNMDTPPNEIERNLDSTDRNILLSYNYTDTPFCRCRDGEELIKVRLETDMETIMNPGLIDESLRELNGVKLMWQCKPME